MKIKPTLNGEDIKILRRMIRHEFRLALFREIDVEEAARPGEDPPREGRVAKKIRVNVLEWFTSYLPYIEGALRGMQSDVGKVNDKIFKQLTPGVATIAELLIANEGNMQLIAKFVDNVKQLAEAKKIESITN